MTDAINPDHYKRLPAEAIEIIESAIEGAPTSQEAYLHGQVLKYMLRCWNKNGIEDLRKAKWYLDRLVDSLDEYEQQKASDLQSLKDHPFGKLRQPKWTPKIGDWVRIRKPSEAERDGCKWLRKMDKYDGLTLQYCKRFQFDGSAIVYKGFAFPFDWLEPAEQPEATVEVAGEVTGEVKPPDGWRWLERGELIRNGDKPVKGDAIPLLWIGTPCCGEEFILRRNRFEVGEKVVHVPSKDILQVIAVAAYVSVVDVRGSVSHYPPELLAPYIEEAK